MEAETLAVARSLSWKVHMRRMGRGTVRTNSAQKERPPEGGPTLSWRLAANVLSNADFARSPETCIAEADETKQHHRPGRRLGDGPRDRADQDISGNRLEIDEIEPRREEVRHPLVKANKSWQLRAK